MDKDGEILLQEIFNKSVEEEAKQVPTAKAPQPSDLEEAPKKEQNDKETHTQWALGGNGRFMPVGATAEKLPAGVYEPFANPGMWGLELLTVSSDGIYQLPDMATEIVLTEVQKFWDSEQRYRDHSLLYKRGLILWGRPGCLGKDVRIPYETRGVAGNTQSCKGGSIERLYQIFHGKTGPGKGRYQKTPPGTTFWVASVDDEGRVLKNKVEDVVYSGEKEVFTLTTETGKQIVATADHKFFTGDTYKRLAELQLGDVVYIHTNKAVRDSDEHPKMNRSYVHVKSHPVAGSKNVGGYHYKKLLRSRAVVEADLNGMSFDAYVDRLNTGNLEGLRFLTRDDNVHHLDENYRNDTLANLRVIKQEEHSRLHGFKKPVYFVAVEDRVKQIERVGVQHTYDLVMSAPYHNFIANGFVVHNSGKTIAIKLLMKELIKRDGVVIVAGNINLTTLCLKAIRRIEAKRNLIVVLEDIDEIISYNGEAAVLSLLDGENSIDNILLVASTNFPEKLGPRIINRPSRFDRRVHVGMPIAAARESYLQQATKGGLSPEKLKVWVADTDGMSIAHLRELVAAVYCLDQEYEDVMDRLKAMSVPVKGEDGFDSRAMGFGVKNSPKYAGIN